jgi:hypothetical protein
MAKLLRLAAASQKPQGVLSYVFGYAKCCAVYLLMGIKLPNPFTFSL